MPSFNCRHPTCPALLPRRGYCPAHQHQQAPANADRHRLYDRTKRDPEAKRFYASAAWQHARAAKLAATPWCEECRRAFATAVHHDKPLAECTEAEKTELKNLVAVCDPCHTRIENRRRRAKRTTAP